MNREADLRQVFLLLLVFLFALSSSACAQTDDPAPKIWIDAPRGNQTTAVGLPVEVISHAFAERGVAEVVLSVNGEAYHRQTPEEAGTAFAEFRQEWVPEQSGKHLLSLVAYDQEGDFSASANVWVSVTGEQASIDPTLTPTPLPDTQEPPDEITVTPVTEEPEPEPVCPPVVKANTNANCRAGPGTEYQLLSTLAEGASAAVIGRSQDSSYWVIERPEAAGNCWIWDELVSLSTDTCKVSVLTAPPPPEPEDTTPPPVPSPMVPANGLELACGASQNLVWLPVEDESGIGGYYLKLEWEVSSGNWQQVNRWGPITGKQKQVPIDCGLRYRWAVQAEDNEGNRSSWSPYSTFTVTLD